jgi:hypothetical protein
VLVLTAISLFAKLLPRVARKYKRLGLFHNQRERLHDGLCASCRRDACAAKAVMHHSRTREPLVRTTVDARGFFLYTEASWTTPNKPASRQGDRETWKLAKRF